MIFLASDDSIDCIRKTLNEEIATLREEIHRVNYQIAIENLFNTVDIDNSGFVDKDEIAKVLVASGVPYKSIDSAVPRIMEKADENNDGKMSKAEFVKFMHLSRKKDSNKADAILIASFFNNTYSIDQ